MASPFYTAAELRKRLSISTLVFIDYRPISESSLSELVENGIRQIELLESPEQYDLTHSGSMGHVATICRNAGVRVAAYHAHRTTFDELDTEEKRTERVDLCRRQIDTLQELGGAVWGCHARLTEDGTVSRSYEELARHIEGSDVIITVENFSREGLFVEDRVAFLDTLDHPQVGMILDIGHVRDGNGENPMTRPGGPADIIGLCGHRLRHIHLHGFIDRDHYPPLCEGDGIQWVELFRVLKESEYPGLINFEPSGEPVHTGSIGAVGGFPERIVEMADHS